MAVIGEVSSYVYVMGIQTVMSPTSLSRQDFEDSICGGSCDVRRPSPQCCSGRRAHVGLPGSTEIARNGEEHRCDAILQPIWRTRHGSKSCAPKCCSETSHIFLSSSPLRTNSSYRKPSRASYLENGAMPQACVVAWCRLAIT
jgi:hypothetical protein